MSNDSIWFVAGEKGGVGKSTVAHILNDYVRERLEGAAGCLRYR